MNESLFKKVENKTNVNKNTILALASKLQNGNMKDEDTLKEVIATLSDITGKPVSDKQVTKIINTVMNDQVPNDFDKYYE